MQQLLPPPCHQGVWLLGGMEGESARKKGWDLGTRAVSLGRREQVVACLSAQLFCISEPERQRLRAEQLGGEKAVQPGALVVFRLSSRSRSQSRAAGGRFAWVLFSLLFLEGCLAPICSLLPRRHPGNALLHSAKVFTG